MLKTLFVITLSAHILGQFSAVAGGGDTRIYLFDIFTGIFSYLGILYFMLKGSFRVPYKLFWFYAFLIIAVASVLLNFTYYSDRELVTGLMYLARFVVYLCAGVVVHNMLKNTIISVRWLENLIITSGMVLGFLGLVQLAVLPDFETLDPLLGWDPHKNRLASTFFDPNFTGAYLTSVIAIVISRVFRGSKKVRRDSDTAFRASSVLRDSRISILKDYYYLAFLLITLLLTFSRSSWLMFAVVIMIYGGYMNRKLLFASLIIITMAYYTVPRIQTRISGITDPADSAHFRIMSWKNTYEIIKEHPITGVGFNMYRYAQKDYGFLTADNIYTHSGAGSDSSLLFIWATTGIFGLLVFLLGFMNPIVSGLIRTSDNGVLLMAIFCALLMESQFVNSLFYPQIMFIWVLFLNMYGHGGRAEKLIGVRREKCQ